jgi:hypothetical protein
MRGGMVWHRLAVPELEQVQAGQLERARVQEVLVAQSALASALAYPRETDHSWSQSALVQEQQPEEMLVLEVETLLVVVQIQTLILTA